MDETPMVSGSPESSEASQPPPAAMPAVKPATKHWLSPEHFRKMTEASKQKRALANGTLAPPEFCPACGQPVTDQAASNVKFSPQDHRQRLADLYGKYMGVYEKGLASKDEKIRIKCADIIRGMHTGAIGVGKPAEDVRNNELMVIDSLPDYGAVPTIGEIEEQQQEEAYTASEQFEDRSEEEQW